MKHGKKEVDDPELTLKPDCSRSQASKAPVPVVQRRRHYRQGFENGSLSRYSQKQSNSSQQQKMSPKQDKKNKQESDSD